MHSEVRGNGNASANSIERMQRRRSANGDSVEPHKLQADGLIIELYTIEREAKTLTDVIGDTITV